MAENAIDEQAVEERIAGFLEAEEAPVEEPQEEVKQEAEEEKAEVEEEAEEKQAEEEESEEIQISTWNELAEHVGTDPAELYNLTIPITGADGQKQEISLGEWKDSYQAMDKLRSEQDKITQERQTFNEKAQSTIQTLEQNLAQSAKIVEIVEGQIVGGINNADLENLRYTDPAEYAAIKQDQQDRLNGLAAIKQQLADEFSQYQQTLQEHNLAERQKYIAQEDIKVREMIPEWSNPTVKEQESKELETYLVNMGVPQEAIGNGMTAFERVVARKAMLYDRQQEAKPEIKKKVVSIGKKVLKSGTPKTKVDRSREEFQKDREKLKKSGNVNDLAALVEKHMLGDM